VHNEFELSPSVPSFKGNTFSSGFSLLADSGKDSSVRDPLVRVSRDYSEGLILEFS